MTNQPMGQLEAVDLRQQWRDESRDFTPWLAQPANIALLGRAVGLDLETETTEKGVGPCFADILCRDRATESWVVIENQLERTDHSHLGQLLTYAAGLEAHTVIWVAPMFTAEHRAALDWLNEITSETFSFFGVEIELWRIGDSPTAPRFNVVCQPNDWSRGVQASAGRRALTEGERLQLEFWTAFKTFMEGAGSIRCPKPQPQTWMSHRLGWRGCHLDSIFSTWDSEAQATGGELRVDVYLDGADAKQLFASLLAQREAIEREMGAPMVWHNPPDTRMSKISERRRADVSAKEQWPAYFQWLRDRLERAADVFGSRLLSPTS